MPHWLIKSALHHAISWLPRSHEWNYLLQKHVTRSLSPGAGGFAHKAADCAKFVEHFRRFTRADEADFTAFELGTGWFPTVPVGLFLCGARRVWTADIVPLLKLDNVRHVLAFYRDEAKAGRLEKLLPRLRPERVAGIEAALASDEKSPSALLARLNIEVLVRDARSTGLAEGSVDLVLSDSVLVHVPGFVLPGIFAEFRRIISKQGVMGHWMGLWDTYERFDRRLTRFNMLRFSERAWRVFNSPVEHQNRLRLPDYRRLHAEAGFEIVAEENGRAPEEELARVPLHADFANMPREDLLVMSSWLVSVPR